MYLHSTLNSTSMYTRKGDYSTTTNPALSLLENSRINLSPKKRFFKSASLHSCIAYFKNYYN